MAWIESHADLGEHPKIYGLCTALNVRKAEAVGFVHLLWHFTIKFAWRDGVLSRFDRTTIARACGWEKEPEYFIESLIAVGLLDNDPLQVHDWLEFAGRLVQDRLYNEKRRTTSVKRRQTSAKRRLSSATNPTQPNQPNPTIISEQNQILLDSFGSVLKEKVVLYISRIMKKNKSGIISEGRRFTILNELFNSKQRCSDENSFGYALDQAISRDACNIGYINAIIKNKKTEKPSEYREYHAPFKAS